MNLNSILNLETQPEVKVRPPSTQGAIVSNALNFRRILHAADVTLRLAGGGVLLAGLSACHEEKAPSPPAVVLALPVHSDNAAALATLRFPTEAAPRYSNPMSFRVAGKVIERKVRIGDLVKKGDLVARLDPTDAEKGLVSAQAALTAAEHRLLFAKQQLDRDTAQAAKNLIASKELEQTQDAYISALSARDQAAAQLVVARDTLDYHTLVADHDGVIASENADTGQVVSAGQTVYGLAWSGDVDVVIDVGAADVGRISVGQPAQVTFIALPGRSFAARVREVSSIADQQSRTYRAKLTLAEPGLAVRLGMTGEAILSSAGNSAQPAFKLPSTAIFHDGTSPGIFVVNPSNSTLELRPVTVLGHSANTAAVAGNLRDGEMVVQAGVHNVHAGEPVSIVRPLFDEQGDVVGPAHDSSRSE